MAESDADDRTQAASVRRLQQAREQGDVPLSREIPVVAGFAAAVLFLAYGMSSSFRTLSSQLAEMLVRPESPEVALRRAGWMILGVLVPFIAVVLVASAAATVVQTNFLFHLGALRPKFSRISPVQGLKRLGGREALLRAGKALLKLALLGWASWHALSGIVPDAGRTLLEPSSALLARITRSLLHLTTLVLATQLLFAGGDLILVRIRYTRRMRMTRTELREETKETEGDPAVKNRLRRLRTARARRRMMTAIPTATVVVTNPTHYAVALRYERGKEGAPRVVAKGVDDLAARIRALAQENRVPLVANPPLARALYTVELDHEVPAEHFQAVAEVIAYVWRLRGRAPRPVR